MPVIPNPITLSGNSIQLFTTDAPGVWTTSFSGPRLFSDAQATIAYGGAPVSGVYFKAPNTPGSGTIAVSSQVGNITIITGFPVAPNYGYDMTPDKLGVVQNVKRDGSANARILGTGTTVRKYKLVFNNRPKSEYLTMQAFWDGHHPHLTFTYNDLWLNLSGTFRFDSTIKIIPLGPSRCNFEVAIAQVEV